MSDESVAAGALRGYAWWLMRTNLNWSKSDYGNLVPLIPFSEEPMLTQYDKPYMIYGYTENVDTRINLINHGSLSFFIRSRYGSDINGAITVLREAFRREDIAARDINQFIYDTQLSDNLTFQTARVSYIEPGSPEQTEQGRRTGIITVNYMYTESPLVVVNSDSFVL